jgi:hypothetical protein
MRSHTLLVTITVLCLSAVSSAPDTTTWSIGTSESPGHTYFYLEHHTGLPGPPLEDIKDVSKALANSKDGFLYLNCSTKVTELLDKLVPKEFESLDDFDRNLVDYFVQFFQKKNNDDKFSGGGPEYFSSGSNPGRDPNSGFHRDIHFDGDIVSFQLNIWIARADISGYPLAFIRPGSVKEGNTDQSLKGYDADYEYVFVPDMKKGEMLVFKGQEVFHGSVVLFSQKRDATRGAVVPLLYHPNPQVQF